MSRLVLCATLLIASLGCAKTDKVSLQTGPRAFTEESYRSVYEAWTRSEQDFSWGALRDVLRVSATFESWEFRWAYTVRYAHDHSLSEQEREQMLRASLGAAQREHRFFVTLSGDDHRESNLTHKTSAWRVLLIDADGNQSVPAKITKIRRPSAADKVYFPSISPHRQTFVVTFDAVASDGKHAIPPGSEHATLRFAGPRGMVDLRWPLQWPQR